MHIPSAASLVEAGREEAKEVGRGGGKGGREGGREGGRASIHIYSHYLDISSQDEVPKALMKSWEVGTLFFRRFQV